MRQLSIPRKPKGYIEKCHIITSKKLHRKSTPYSYQQAALTIIKMFSHKLLCYYVGSVGERRIACIIWSEDKGEQNLFLC